LREFQNAVNNSVGGFRNFTPEMFDHYHRVMAIARKQNYFNSGDAFEQTRNGVPVGFITLSGSRNGDSLEVPGLVSYSPTGGSGAYMLEFAASQSEKLGLGGKLTLVPAAKSVNFYRHLGFTRDDDGMSLDPRLARGWSLKEDRWSRVKSGIVNHPPSPSPAWGPTLVMTGPGIPMTVYKQGRDHALPGMYSQRVLGPTYLPQSSEKVDPLEIMRQSYKMTTGKDLPMGYPPRANT
jgi:hypothetical protein